MYARYHLKRLVNYTTLGEKTSECHYPMQPPTGTGIVFLKLNILTLAKRDLR